MDDVDAEAGGDISVAVEDILEFFSRASNGGLPCSSELVDLGPPFPYYRQFSFLDWYSG
jgi:hypothetical protein